MQSNSASIKMFYFYPTASHPATVPIRRTVVTLVAGRSVCVSAFVCLPLGQNPQNSGYFSCWSVGLRVCFCLLAAGSDFWCIFCRFGLQGSTLGTHKRHLDPKNDHFGTPFGKWVSRGQIFSEFGVHFGSYFGCHFAHWRSLLATVALFWHPFFSDVFGTVSGTCPGRANVAKTQQILYQNEISHVGKRVDFGAVLDHIWHTFGRLLAPIVVKWVPLQRA